MSRHRNFRGKNFVDENEDFDDVYGHSYEDNDYSVSPETSSQFIIDRSKNLTPTPIINNNEISNFTYEEPNKDFDKAKLYSCLESIQDIIGESISEDIIIAQILKNNFDSEKTLASLLSSNDSRTYLNNSEPKEKEHSKPYAPSNTSFSSNIAPKNSLTNSNLALSRQERFAKLFSSSNNSPTFSNLPNKSMETPANYDLIKNKVLPKPPLFFPKLPSFNPTGLKKQELTPEANSLKDLPKLSLINESPNVPITVDDKIESGKEYEEEIERKERLKIKLMKKYAYAKKLKQMLKIHDLEGIEINKNHSNKIIIEACHVSSSVSSHLANILLQNSYVPHEQSQGFECSYSIYDKLNNILAPNFAQYSYTEPCLNVRSTPELLNKHAKEFKERLETKNLISHVEKLTLGDKANLYLKSPRPSQLPKSVSPATQLINTPAAAVKSSNIPHKMAVDKFDVAKEFAKKRVETGDNVLNVIVIGHVDAGKSTLMGHLLYLSGNVLKKAMHKNEVESKKVGKGSFAYAWVLDETSEERSRGITMDVAQRRLKVKGKVVNLIDAPGHKDFIPNMINGTSQAEAAVLVVDATKGEFETGFELGGQTREHALLARSLGISQMVVVVNKMDNVGWNEERFRSIVERLFIFLKQIGFKDKHICAVPCSGLLGQNVADPSQNPPSLNAWWNPDPANTLLGKIENFELPKRAIDKPYRFVISDVYKSPVGSGICLNGKMEAGVVKTGDKAIILPPNENATIKSIRLDDLDEGIAFAGDNATIIVTGSDLSNLMSSASGGLVLCPASAPVPLVYSIEAKIILFNNLAVPITLGFNAVFHYQTANEPCVLTKLISLLNKTTGEVVKTKPRVLAKNCSATVEITFQRPVCLELYSDCKELGRFTLRHSSASVCAGIVTKIIR